MPEQFIQQSSANFFEKKDFLGTCYIILVLFPISLLILATDGKGGNSGHPKSLFLFLTGAPKKTYSGVKSFQFIRLCFYGSLHLIFGYGYVTFFYNCLAIPFDITIKQLHFCLFALTSFLWLQICFFRVPIIHFSRDCGSGFCSFFFYVTLSMQRYH